MVSPGKREFEDPDLPGKIRWETYHLYTFLATSIDTKRHLINVPMRSMFVPVYMERE